MKEPLMFFAVALSIIFGAGFLYFSDYGLISNADCLEYAYEVLGDSAYGQSCQRSSYRQTIETLDSSETSNGAAFFIFRPVEGKEVECPAIEILVDRRDATVSVTRINKDGKPQYSSTL
ncbi:MAG: hypothetical protein WC736_13510 [Gallionella sp.]